MCGLADDDGALLARAGGYGGIFAELCAVAFGVEARAESGGEAGDVEAVFD